MPLSAWNAVPRILHLAQVDPFSDQQASPGEPTSSPVILVFLSHTGHQI